MSSLNTSLLSQPLTPVDDRCIFAFNIPELSNITPYNLPSTYNQTSVFSPQTDFNTAPDSAFSSCHKDVRHVSMPADLLQGYMPVFAGPSFPLKVNSNPDPTLKVRPFSIKIEHRRSQQGSSASGATTSGPTFSGGYKKPAAMRRRSLGHTGKIGAGRVNKNVVVLRLKKCTFKIGTKISSAFRLGNGSDENCRKNKYYFLWDEIGILHNGSSIIVSDSCWYR